MNHKLIAIFAIFCATSITVSYGLKCFECTWSSIRGDDTDKCEKDPPSSSSIVCKDPLDPDSEVNWACYKLEMKMEGERSIDRGCINKTDIVGGYKNECRDEDEDEDGTSISVCTCDKDDCNSGVNLNAGLLLPAILLLSKLFIF